ncbi:RNA pseudouridylate synthase domain containing protein 2 [Cichlidogyrus casuarinus]|uniref:RNA pseudouridylate synthase domain containing protein 2 n=1 Tax=Cichlidogyrus casuarinus TaxID=1844966 RepID=A0ABD2QA62_9PLAT
MVDGDFPQDSPQLVERPIGPLCQRMGIQYTPLNEDVGKRAKTAVYGLGTFTLDGEKKSIVVVRIYTGRTHQIRVHLQYLGYPITRDPVYNSEAWGPNKGKGADYQLSLDELIKNVTIFKNKSHVPLYSTDYSDPAFEGRSFDPARYNEIVTTESDTEKLHASLDPHCLDCVNGPQEDPRIESLILYLHAYQYSGEDWNYTAPLPDWCDLYLSESKQSSQEFQQAIKNAIHLHLQDFSSTDASDSE